MVFAASLIGECLACVMSGCCCGKLKFSSRGSRERRDKRGESTVARVSSRKSVHGERGECPMYEIPEWSI